jgi:transcriptional regulator with PAS, ATPase and Fis domain
VDELPWLIQGEIQRARSDRVASVGFVEACALRAWPGNVRELLREVRLAAHASLEPGTHQILAQHLAPDAGEVMETVRRPSSIAGSKAPSPPSDQQIEASLAEHQGNVTRAAKALGLHRNQLRRWLAKRPGERQLDDDASTEGSA